MFITDNYDNIKFYENANLLAKQRGYNGLADIDDPILREWIIEKSSGKYIVKKRINISIIELVTTVIMIFLAGLLLGTML